MNKEERYTLEILNRIEENGRVTQPEIATHLGISLGLANAFIKRIARKGYIKLTTIPRDRAKYLLTPQGIAEKSHLTLKYLQYSLTFYKQAKATFARTYARLEKDGVRNIVFYGAGEIAEIAYILLQQKQMKLAGVIDEKRAGGMFLKYRVGAVGDLKKLNFDKIIITEFESADKIIITLRDAAVPENKILILKDATIPQAAEDSKTNPSRQGKKAAT